MAKIIKGKYLDSVKLMLVSKALREMSGVSDAVAILATKENREILAATEMLVDEILDAAETDLVIVVKAATTETAEKAIVQADELINAPSGHKGSGNVAQSLHNLEAASNSLNKGDLCLISIAGKYAAVEADKALELGLHVMLFSDNVSLEDELKLKQKAVAKGLLMMGPDCGTAIINGVPLAFANKVPRGNIGIVSASGTGLQEVSVGLARFHCGVSQAFGTGGRDGKKEIGGIMLLAFLDYLINDAQTQVIVLIGKTPDTIVLDKLWQQLAITAKPVVVNFLTEIAIPNIPNMQYTSSLDETAELACAAYNKLNNIIIATKAEETTIVFNAIGKGSKYIRGLYSGGTLCYEALQLYHQYFGKYPFSNISTEPEYKMADAWHSEGDCFIDLGADDFTVGRPHPMIDYSLRLKKMQIEAKDPDTAIILIDVVLGYGAHPDPASELVPVIAALPKDIVVVCHVLGTKDDPQNVEKQAEQLANAGAIVFTAHHKAVVYALELLKTGRNKA
ncbi:MAG: acyl-CoA synthetase FdrA [Candidatus Cloacimonas sp.]|nr:acyl-CoA synthetase FdrA [Candidatus Cloacimonas sp.]